MPEPIKLRIGYVPEHFSSPLLQLGRSSWGLAHLELVSQPSGTGQMLSSLSSDQAIQQEQKIDVAVALTESLIAALAKGREDFKLVGSYVKSSLNWAVITGTSPHAERYQSIEDLKGEKIGISRVGSGSMVMASVMALLQGWTDENGKASEVQFKVQDTFENLRRGVNFPPKQTSGPSESSHAPVSTASGQISAKDFADSAESYVSKYSDGPSQPSLGAHVFSEGWKYSAAPVPLLERSFDLLADPASQNEGARRTVLRVQQVIARSSTWGTPVLYFRASTAEGTLLTLSEIESSSLLIRNTGEKSNTTLPIHTTSAPTDLDADAGTAPSEWASLSLGNHPVTDETWIMLHPCQTAPWISLLRSNDSSSQRSSSSSGVQYIEAFMNLCASAVQMRSDQSRPGTERGPSHRSGHGQSAEKPETAAFMWEWFTTKPFVDSGEVRFIGNVPTPWPSWSIAASVPTVLSNASSSPSSDSSTSRTKLHILSDFLHRLQAQIIQFTSDEDEALRFVQNEMGYEASDVKLWYERVRWVGDSRSSLEEQHSVPSSSVAASQTHKEDVKTKTKQTGQDTSTSTVSKETLLSTLQTLLRAGAIPAPSCSDADNTNDAAAWNVKSFVWALPSQDVQSGLVD
ncbi:ALIPHATIC SULFONATES-BINDING PROTEIN-RELATED [Ceraceosorus bombacis]|uniref:ALIPHATIC SULFONATES-BINDING PROTEIN-RELATED n=1 Tax=Ceraceosorus bombacis TaxID=401625 RepID=A0A0P1BEP3_9BASI|nr:ALIPHATIC SULFONATES-BINDING PROTEIN-RELATED [Ceraceosorus bombacis]